MESIELYAIIGFEYEMMQKMPVSMLSECSKYRKQYSIRVV